MRVTKLLLFSLFVAGSAFAAPDYRPIYKALTDFFAVMDNLKTELPKIQDAGEAVKAVDSFTDATNAFAASLEDYIEKNPDLVRNPEPPPEIADVMKKFAKAKDLYPTLGADLGRAVKPFAKEPSVRAAIVRFQDALSRMNRLGNAR
jgi:hypothetical protein